MSEDISLVTIAIKDHVADVRLNRPDKYNALSPAMFQAVVDAGEKIAQLSDVRAVVLSGEGPGFCAGLDMESFQSMGSGSQNQDLDHGIPRPENSVGNIGQYASHIWKSLKIPVIAAVHGVAYGGGLQIALGADIRIAAPSARLSIMEIKWGLIPDMAITQTIRDIMSMDVVKELVFTGRVLSAEEAEKLGLITRIAENPHAEAMALAAEIASKNPNAIKAGKQLLEETWHDARDKSLSLEEKLQLELIGSPNQKEAVLANFQKRAPKFT